uniref:peroxisomal membrane protein 4 n=1 Tax=Myxine glutinosa TaxID=7769 RepID=UPI00358F34A7
MPPGPGLGRAIKLVNKILLIKKYQALLALLKGFRNGAVYGAKVRAPHALVTTFLFRSSSVQEKLKTIVRATYTHSRNLACFVFIYKSLTGAQRWLQGCARQPQAFLAACVGGWLVFGNNNSINSQINMYLLSRILFGLVRLGAERGLLPRTAQDPFPLFAALIWGIVLWLFEYHRHVLQPSLRGSMIYLYDDSNVWHDVMDWLVFNKPRQICEDSQ